MEMLGFSYPSLINAEYITNVILVNKFIDFVMPLQIEIIELITPSLKRFLSKVAMLSRSKRSIGVRRRRRDSARAVCRGSLMFSLFSISCALFILYCYLSPLVADIATSVATCLLSGQVNRKSPWFVAYVTVEGTARLAG